ncbi:MAG: sigma 54-interacting transcriptional regulator [Planctomycetota bacterium]|jgi:PAS domain S-box-containing protein
MPNIMVIDDEVSILELLESVFESGPHNVSTCAIPQDAMEMARKEKPDLFLIDFNMPKLNGIEVCEQLKNDPKFSDAIIIMMSGLLHTKNRSEDIVKGFNAGINDYFLKPFDVDELEARVNAWLSVKRSRDSMAARADKSARDLKQEKSYTETILSAMADSLFVINKKGVIESCNQQASKVLEAAHDKLEETNIENFIADEDSRTRLSHLITRASGGGVHDIDTILKTSSDKEINVSLSCSEMPDKSRLVLVARDISDRKKLQEEQKKYAEKLEHEVEIRAQQIINSEAKYQLTFENVSQGLIITDMAGKIINCNNPASRILEISREKIADINVMEILFSTDKHSDYDNLIKYPERGLTWTHECAVQLPSGKKAILQLSTSILRDKDGDLIFWVITDLTEMERLEQLVTQNKAYTKQVMSHGGFGTTLVGEGPEYTKIKNFILDSAGSDLPTLVLGESGTGKEVVARSIHYQSSRKEKPFVVLDCAAIQPTLLERELFGHEAGAFTGADKAMPGLVEMADGGTLFVDEIGEMPLELQAKLLRVLEYGTFRAVGSAKEKEADIRVVSATNRDLQQEIENKNFRSDLFYRLNVLSITLPPLRKRREDIPLLTTHFLSRSKVTLGSKKKLRNDAMDCLINYSWPGNVRELANVIERAVILSRESSAISPECLPEEIRSMTAGPKPDDSFLTLEAAEKGCLKKALEASDYNQTVTSKKLGISRMTLWRKMQKHGLT